MFKRINALNTSIQSISDDQTHQNKIIKLKELQRQTATQFSSLSPPFFHVHPPREDKRLYRVWTRKRRKEMLRRPVYPLIFRVISGVRSPPTCDLAHRNYKTHFSVSPSYPPFLTKMQLAARDSILDPLHGTWSWSSFTAVIDLTVSFEGLAQEEKMGTEKREICWNWIDCFVFFHMGTSCFNCIGLKKRSTFGNFIF